jgi:hypothetical protein
MTFGELFPQIAPLVASLPNTFPGNVIKPQFATWEVLHILSLIILGGTSVVLNLRLVGFGLTNAPPSEVERNLRLWINVGVIGVVASGVLIGLANAERLYNSNAFTVKIIALVAGVIFTYGVSAPVARAEGEVGKGPLAWWIAGLVVFAAALWVFLTSKLINPGLYHMLSAAALIVLLVTRGRLRWVYLALLGVLMAAQYVTTHVLLDTLDFEKTDPANKTFFALYTLTLLGFGGYSLLVAKRDPQGRPLTTVIGYVSILVWVVAAAAGRWIAFA